MKKKRVTRRNSGGWLFAIAILFLFLIIIVTVDRRDYEKSVLDREQKRLLSAITSDSVADETAFIINNNLDKERLLSWAKKSYYSRKSDMGVNNDFAILFTNGNGELVQIENYTCIGSPNTKVAGMSCG